MFLVKIYGDCSADFSRKWTLQYVDNILIEHKEYIRVVNQI